MKQLSPLGEAINRHMISESMSWYKLAILSGVNEGSLSKIKHGKASPTLYTLERIAKALNTKVSNILSIAENLNRK